MEGENRFSTCTIFDATPFSPAMPASVSQFWSYLVEGQARICSF